MMDCLHVMLRLQAVIARDESLGAACRLYMHQMVLLYYLLYYLLYNSISILLQFYCNSIAILVQS